MQPAWYQDPQNPALLRWWDGNQWTAHTHEIPPATPQTAQPAQPAQPAWSQPQQSVPQPSWQQTQQPSWQQQGTAQPSWQQQGTAQPAWQQQYDDSSSPERSGTLRKALLAVGVVVVLVGGGLVALRYSSGAKNVSLTAACTDLSVKIDSMAAEGTAFSETVSASGEDWMKARDATLSYMGETVPSALLSLADVASAVATDSSISDDLRSEATTLASNITNSVGKLREAMTALKAATSETEFMSALNDAVSSLDDSMLDTSDELSVYFSTNAACKVADEKMASL